MTRCCIERVQIITAEVTGAGVVVAGQSNGRQGRRLAKPSDIPNKPSNNESTPPRRAPSIPPSNSKVPT